MGEAWLRVGVTEDLTSLSAFIAPGLGPGLQKCHAAGLNPPLPGGPSADRSEISRLLARARRG